MHVCLQNPDKLFQKCHSLELKALTIPIVKGSLIYRVIEVSLEEESLGLSLDIVLHMYAIHTLLKYGIRPNK